MEAAWWPGGGPECPKGTKMEICDAPRIDFSLGKSNGCEQWKYIATNTVRPMFLKSNFNIFPKWAPKVFINDRVYKERVVAFRHFFGLRFSQWKSNDAQLGENATRDSGKRNAFWH